MRYRIAVILMSALLPAAGCDIAAKPFAGTIIQMTLDGAAVTPAGQHLELWARDQYDDVLRISGIYDTTAAGRAVRLFPDGLAVRLAITMDDPCMIDGAGNLLTKAEAYHDATIAGVYQTAEEQAQSVRSRIAQVTSTSSCDGSGGTPAYHCGHQNATMTGAIAYELVDDSGTVVEIAPAGPRTCETVPPGESTSGCISYAAAPADRLAACSAYWENPLAYTPNPLQITAPIHGQLYGELAYVTTTPPSAFNSLRIDSNVNLRGIRELFFTVEPDQVMPLARGPLFLDGTPDAGGRDVVHFDLAPPLGSTMAVSGSAALLVELDENPVQF